MYAVENKPPYVIFLEVLAENEPVPRGRVIVMCSLHFLCRILLDIMLHTKLLLSSFAPHVGNDVAPMGVLLLCARLLCLVFYVQ